MSHHRQLPQNATSGSQTESSHSHDRNGSSTPSNFGMLRLRAENASNEVEAENASSARHIRWSEDVIDNEGMGKKSSKVCCIYHKARPVGESSSESDSSDSSSSESDSDSEVDSARRSSNAQRSTNSQDGPSNQIRREHTCSADHRHKRPSKRRKPSPNAYEKMPRTSK
ncbi:hypothetical protein P168DRAFT_313272 [Aspergillus campestris IBT 28561]|uniref:Type 1 phosphatases regulator n=1 Tax=Aspergillus campestris (strain IBT 28561) TaxID=1392248 RepID=A0A2I1CTK4_ASPC2|nr:uncharacterized protein P168DRAFT_313272 [Aspergillus campestris IBT 28561]PKY00963.1 hypothetical protein P168DRAFT_313272 [Aspergillus campestris IBT 28561]